MEKEEKTKKSTKKGGIITGMIVGGAVGSVLSLLFSSKKGKKYSKDAWQKTSSTAEKFLKKYRNKSDKKSVDNPEDSE